MLHRHRADVLPLHARRHRLRAGVLPLVQLPARRAGPGERAARAARGAGGPAAVRRRRPSTSARTARPRACTACARTTARARRSTLQHDAADLDKKIRCPLHVLWADGRRDGPALRRARDLARARRATSRARACPAATTCRKARRPRCSRSSRSFCARSGARVELQRAAPRARPPQASLRLSRATAFRPCGCCHGGFENIHSAVPKRSASVLASATKNGMVSGARSISLFACAPLQGRERKRIGLARFRGAS